MGLSSGLLRGLQMATNLCKYNRLGIQSRAKIVHKCTLFPFVFFSFSSDLFFLLTGWSQSNLLQIILAPKLHILCLLAKSPPTNMYYPSLYILSIKKIGRLHGTVVKNLPAMQETQVWSLGLEDHLEKEMATHSSILAWEIPCTEESWGHKGWTQLTD